MSAATRALLLGLILIPAGLAQPPANKDKDKDNIPPPADPSSIGGKTLKEWREELTSKDASRRAVAIVAIMQFGDSASRCVPDLLLRLEDPDVSPRTKALVALRAIPVEEKSIPDIVRAVSKRLNPTWEKQAVVRLEATSTLGRFIAECGPAIPTIIQATMDTASWEIRHNSIALLWRTGVETTKDSPGGDRVSDNRITEALLTCLRTAKTYQEKLETIQGLGAMGRPWDTATRSKVISELSLCTNTTNKAHRPLTIWAFAGLVAMEDGQAAEASLNNLAKFLKSPELEVRVQAATALGALKAKAKKRVPALLAMLKDKEPAAIGAACNALAMIGDTSDAVVDPLMELLANKEPGHAAIAVTALVQLKQNTTRVLTAFDKLRDNKDLDLRLRALIEEATRELKKPVKK